MTSLTSKKGTTEGVIVVKKMKNYSNDPFFKKKAEKAAEFIKKNGVPAAFTNKK